MADLSKIKVPNGTTYDLKDATARSMIDALDGSITGTAGASKTLTAFSQANGIVSATFGNISITKSQVSDFPTIPEGLTDLTNDTSSTNRISGAVYTNYHVDSGGSALNTDLFHRVTTNSGAIALESVGNANGDGNRGIWAGSHGSSESGRWLIRVDTDNVLVGTPDIAYAGAILASGDNIATLPVGTTYYSPSSGVSASLSGSPPTTSSGFKIITIQEYSTARRRQIALGNGSEAYWHRYSTDSGSTWTSWVSPFSSGGQSSGGGKTSLWTGAITSGSATLSDSVANYDMILVVASNGQTGTSFVSTMCDQAGKFNVGWEASAAYIEFTLSGSTITINNASTGRYLRRVVGYKLSGDANYTNADSTSY